MKKIESFTIVTLHLGGMRITMDYEIVADGDAASITLYTYRYGEGKHWRVPEESAACSPADVLSLLNDCGVLKWDGFYGEHPRGVLDGTMFTFTATVNGDRRIRAEGSQNFPKHFRDLEDGLRRLLGRETG